MGWGKTEERLWGQKAGFGSGALKFILPQIANWGLVQEDVDILSIGAGAGELEAGLMREFGAKMFYVDTSPTLYEKFAKELTEPHLQKKVLGKFIGTFQDFHTDSRFDLVLAVQSWHYIGLNENELRRAISYLKPEGRLCIVLTSENAFTKEIKSLLHPDGHEFINCEEMSRWANARESVLFHELKVASKLVPLEKFLGPDDFTEYGKVWISFMCRRSWEDIDSEVKSRARSIMMRWVNKGMLDDAWGAVIFRS